METRDLKQIIKILENSSLEMIEIEQNGVRIQVKKPTQNVVAATGVAAPAPGLATTQTVTTTTEAVSGTPVKSPLVGTYYGSPTPEDAAYVSVGSTVKEGQVLCIIEAMKVMNEIKAPKAGKITSILVKNEEMVEFDQTIFTIE